MNLKLITIPKPNNSKKDAIIMKKIKIMNFNFCQGQIN